MLSLILLGYVCGAVASNCTIDCLCLNKTNCSVVDCCHNKNYIDFRIIWGFAISVIILLVIVIGLYIKNKRKLSPNLTIYNQLFKATNSDLELYKEIEIEEDAILYTDPMSNGEDLDYIGDDSVFIDNIHTNE